MKKAILDSFEKKFHFYEEYDAGVLAVDSECIGGNEAAKVVKQFLSDSIDSILDECVDKIEENKTGIMTYEHYLDQIINQIKELKKL